MKEVIKIGEFASRLGRHANTIDGWFKDLEEQRIHFVNRVGNEKVYDELDFSIAEYIKEKRVAKPTPWSKEAIYTALPDVFELRPFPPDFKSESSNMMVDLERIKQRITEEIAATVEAKLAQQLQTMKNLLPDPDQLRTDRMNDLITQRRILAKLREEASTLWDQKSWWERRNSYKRSEFIESYIDKNFEEKLKAAYEKRE